MKYQNLLFARTPYRDYRWIFTPSFFSPADLDKLELLIWAEESRDYLDQMAVCPFFLIRLSESYALCRFYRSEFVDSGNRPIDCIDGIATSNANTWLLRLALPILLTSHSHILHSWKLLEFEHSDSYTRQIPSLLHFDIDGLDISTRRSGYKENYRHLDFPFTEQGFQKLVNYLYLSSEQIDLSLLQIAYGVPSSKVNLYHDFEIVTVINPPTSSNIRYVDTNAQKLSISSFDFDQKTPKDTSSFLNKDTLPSSDEFNEKVKALRQGRHNMKDDRFTQNVSSRNKPSIWSIFFSRRKNK